MGKLFIRILYLACAAVVVAEFVVHRHASFGIENMPLFYALYGFVAFLIVVGGGVVLRRFITRPPNYYESEPDD